MQVPIQPDDDFLILACDGVWDVVSSQQAVTYVHKRLLKHRDVQRASREVSATDWWLIGGLSYLLCTEYSIGSVCLNKRHVVFAAVSLTYRYCCVVTVKASNSGSIDSDHVCLM